MCVFCFCIFHGQTDRCYFCCCAEATGKQLDIFKCVGEFRGETIKEFLQEAFLNLSQFSKIALRQRK